MNMNDRSTIEYNPPAAGMKLEVRRTRAPMTIWTFGPQLTAQSWVFGEKGW